MNEISIDEAKKRLINACIGLYGYFVLDFNYEGVTENSFAYESHNGIIIKRSVDCSSYWWHICDLGNTDMTALIKEARTNFGYDNKYELLYFMGNTPENYDASNIRLRFTRIGETSDYDFDIRLLSENDRKQMENLTIVPCDDSDRVKNIAENIIRDFDNAENSDMYLIGIFDGTILAGAISIADRWGKLMYISNIFVSRNYRGRKYATRLIRAATAMYPGVVYTYECDVDNFASIASAKSSDYTLAGTYIFR